MKRERGSSLVTILSTSLIFSLSLSLSLKFARGKFETYILTLLLRSSVGVRESLLREDDSHVKSGKIRPGAVLGAGGACR